MTADTGAVVVSDAVVISDLHVRFGETEAIRGIDLTVPAGGRVGIVGESGAGKSLTALAIMGLLADGWSTSGSIMHDGVDVLTLSDRQMSRRRGRTMSMIFQDPLSSLNPTRRVESQLTGVIRRHTGASRQEAHDQALDLLRSLHMPRPEQILRAYPHQLSGGQRQRVMIASALACYPKVIIADEPTTALDVTVQKQVLRLLDAAISDRGCALLMITHDLPVVAALCDYVAVMYAGRIVEAGPIGDVFTSPRHPYTAALLRAQPTMDNIDLDRPTRLESIPGSMPAINRIPSGCAFRPRCERAIDACTVQPTSQRSGRHLECWNPLDSLDSQVVADGEVAT
jgi:peptide/nickel transport system ATP-binding protein